jgi:altronate dehydratase
MPPVNQNEPTPFEQIGRLPAPGDNVAIASRTLQAGTEVVYGGQTIVIDFTLLEGHRFAVQSIGAGESLYSWGLPFGVAIRPIQPGEYVCNESMIEALRGRSLDFEIPEQPNFRNRISPYILDEGTFQPGQQVARHVEERRFLGYRRSPARGVGTRNLILILGTTSQTASYARLLEAQLGSVAQDQPNVDGIVAISHTEGSGQEPLNNRAFLLRTLAGLMVHSNVGAVLAVDSGPDQISNGTLQDYLITHRYPISDVPHHFLTLSGNLKRDLAVGEEIVRGWLALVNGMARTEASLAHLSLALQCGGSDAFSGISGNPLAGAVAREIIRYGGRANLAETDELIGAESYMLKNVRDLDTARAFLNTIAAFKERLSWHGATAESNTSGGNKYRGLYNITLKSIGAAMKRHPEVRLDQVLDYGQRMEHPGFYFMNSPGNDLESLAGQVAGGSNIILFVTGNGSITNFPLAPTLKIMTATGRFEMLAQDMDINAGAYQDGMEMAELTKNALDMVVSVASGERSAGERAGHAQVSIWRNWRQKDSSQVAQLLARPKPTSEPLSISVVKAKKTEFRMQAIVSDGRIVTDQVGLILPTSLCAGQIARLSAERLNRNRLGQPDQLSRFVALPHTEGCGVATHTTADVFDRTMVNYMIHPLVRYGLFLEHGCEKTHNDHMRHLLRQRHHDLSRFGWASIQMDGGIERVVQKIEAWFGTALAQAEGTISKTVGLDQLSLGLLAAGEIPDPVVRCLTQLTQAIVGAGGTVIVPQPDRLLTSKQFLKLVQPDRAPVGQPIAASLAYGQVARKRGFHVMETLSRHWIETLTGLAATGIQIMLAYVNGKPVQAHPLVPLIQITSESPGQSHPTTDFDLVLEGENMRWAENVLHLVAQVGSRLYRPKLLSQGNVDFQLTRGLLGIST